MRSNSIKATQCQPGHLVVDRVATGKRLSKLRKAANFSQELLADEFYFADMQTSTVSISAWENGHSLPSVEKFVFLSGLYGVTLDSLIATKQSYDGDDDGQAVSFLFCYLYHKS